MAIKINKGLNILALIMIGIEELLVALFIIIQFVDGGGFSSGTIWLLLLMLLGILAFVFQLKKNQSANPVELDNSELLDSLISENNPRKAVRQPIISQVGNFLFGVINLIIFIALILDFNGASNEGVDEIFLFFTFIFFLFICGYIAAYILVNAVLWFLRKDGILKEKSDTF
jgi:hypothetical protein